MDGQRFDAMTRAYASSYSRRGAVKVILGGAAGGALALLGRGATAHHSPDHCRAVGANCNRNQPCCPSANPCVEHVCLPAGNGNRGVCAARPRPAGSACPDDGDLCTADVCDGQGTCTHPPTVTCGSPDQCHQAGVCNPSTGACDYALMADGTTCDDGDPCTIKDLCIAGECVGTPRDCSDSDGPCSVGRCNQQIGGCEVVPLDDDIPCDDVGDLCTEAGFCRSGTCIPGPRRECAPSGPCVEAICDSKSGECVEMPLADGVACDDGNPCTQNDTCQGGRCMPGSEMPCAAGHVCADIRCNPASGTCDLIIPFPDGTVCDDGDPCTTDNRCAAGDCVGTPVTCGSPTDCQVSVACDGLSGTCVAVDKPDGTACATGVCFGGSCCTPTTCAAQGKNCGTISDGCGGMLDCGTCTAPNTCGGGGGANVCGCRRKTCADVIRPCGTFEDGCGGFIICQACGSGCFVAGTRVAMANGTSKPIELVGVGDRVLGRDGRVNRVLDLARPVLGDRKLYALNDSAPFVTAGHPFLTTEGWKAIDPAASAIEVPNLHVGRLAVGDRLLALTPAAVPALVGGPEVETGTEARSALVPLESLVGRTADPATPLFNLRVDGDHTYFADDLLVHNKLEP